MLWIFEGTHPPLVDKARKQIISQHKPDEIKQYVWFSESSDEIVHHAEAQGLFSEKSLIIFGSKNPSEFLDLVETLHQSENLFIAQLEKKLLAPERKKIKDIPCIFCISEKKKEFFNTFSLSDALVHRNKKDLWVLYQKATQHKIVPEEIVHVLLWQCKNMLLLVSSKQAVTGLKPFVESKARLGTKNFTETEIRTMTRSLTDMYQKSRHLTGFNFGVALERFILSL